MRHLPRPCVHGPTFPAFPTPATTAQSDMPAIKPTDARTDLGADARPDVLVIDGSAASRYRLRHQLRGLDARVQQAASVEHALPGLRDQRPDLIITAPTLPGMNALDLLSLLADDARAPPVAVHLADDNWPLRHMATRLGAVAVLQDQQLAERLPGLLEQVGHRTGAAGVRPAIAGQIPARSSPADAQILATATAASGGHCGRTVIWLAVVCLAFGLVIGLAL
jgi:CheY-like chemotaxis protein